MNSPAAIKPMPANMLPLFVQITPRENMKAATKRPKTDKTILKISCLGVGDFSREADG